MPTFRDIYAVLSYALLAVQVGFISILLYTRLISNHDIYFGNADNPVQVSPYYFYVLRAFLYSTFALMVVWAMLTPLVVIFNRRSQAKDRIHGAPAGVLGFIMAIVLLIIDPFGIFKWFTDLS